MILFTFIISQDSCLMTFETELTLLTPHQIAMPGISGLFVVTTQHIRRKRTGRGSSGVDRAPRNQQTARQFRLKRGEVQIRLKTRIGPQETPLAPNLRDLFRLKKGKGEGGKDCATGVDRRPILHLIVLLETKTLSPRSRTRLWKPPLMKREILERILQNLTKNPWSREPV